MIAFGAVRRGSTASRAGVVASDTRADDPGEAVGGVKDHGLHHTRREPTMASNRSADTAVHFAFITTTPKAVGASVAALVVATAADAAASGAWIPPRAATGTSHDRRSSPWRASS